MKPYYDEDGITIYHGDCREVMADLGPGGFDMVFTSPPYNLGVSSGGGLAGGLKSGKWQAASLANGYADHNDAMPLTEYEAWQVAVLRQCWQQLTANGAIFYNHKPRVQNGQLWMPTDLHHGLPLRQIVTWVRGGGINFATTHFVPTYEWILIYAKPSWRLKSKGVSGLGDAWRVPQTATPLHPAPFPLKLPALAIEAAAPKRVLDPFMGSGTTLRAAKDAGIRGVGIELSERYCEIAVQRLAQGVLAFDREDN